MVFYSWMWIGLSRSMIKLGHIAGDETLKKFATFLQEQFEPYGVVGRVGGDEFA